MAPRVSCHAGPAVQSLLLLILLLVNEGMSLDVRNKPASSSSAALGNAPSKSVDGDFGTFSHNEWMEAENKRNPWWRVDLKAIYCLRRITIINRLELQQFANWLAGGIVRAGLNSDHSLNPMVGSPITLDQVSSFNNVIDFILDSIVTARYVSVELPGDDRILSPAEVIVEEAIDEEATALTGLPLTGSAAMQSSTLGSQWAASNAVDRAFQYDDPHCSQTSVENNPWWRLDLMSNQCVRKITIKTRDALNINDRYRFGGAVVRAGLSSVFTTNMMCGSPVTRYQAVANNWMEFACNSPDGVIARYVSVDIQGSNKQLALCEVLVTSCDQPEVDYTLVTNPALIGQTGDNDAVIAVYRGPTEISADDVSFGRQLLTGGSNYGLPSGSSETLDQMCESRQLQMSATGGIDRTGVFYFQAITYEKTIRIQTVILPKEGSNVIRPSQRTQVANIGDSVTLVMQDDFQSNNYIWRHNGGNIITTGNNPLSFTIDDVTSSDEGIYTCVVSNNENQQHIGITRLLVRECSENMWGPPSCMRTCRRCYNGGICDDKTGKCICAPGFSGKHCFQVHGRNIFGQNGGQRCSAGSDDPHSNACQGRLFCLPDPYGCSCAAGYLGLDCMQECTEGTYGADCKQTCHCVAGSTCSKDTGECSDGTCESPYIGNNCQCSIAENTPVEVIPTSVMQRNVSFFWSRPPCEVHDPILSYAYKLTDIAAGTMHQSSNVSENYVTIGSLTPYTEYSFQVAATTSTTTLPYSEALTVWTTEAEPTVPLNVIILAVDENSITVQWEKPNPPHGNITNYDIAYWETGSESTRSETTDIGIGRLFHQISPLTLNVTYSFQVRAKTVVGAGPWSEHVTATVEGVPGVILNLRWTERNDDSVTLDWDPPLILNGSLPRYVVEYKALVKLHQPDFKPETSYMKKEVDNAPFTTENLEPGTKYGFRVSAKNTRHTGDFAAVEVYTRPLMAPPAPSLPVIYEDETTDSTVTINLASALPTSNTAAFVGSYVVQVKKVDSSSVVKREAFIPKHYNDSADDYIAAEVPKQDVSARFVVGDGTYGEYYNAPLQSEADYEIRVGSLSRGNGTETSVTFSEPVKVNVSPKAGSPIGMVVGIVCTALILIIFVIVVVVFRKRRSKNRRHNGEAEPPKDIALGPHSGNAKSGDEKGDGTSSDALDDLEVSVTTVPTPSPSLAKPKPSPRKTVPSKRPEHVPVRADELASFIAKKESSKECEFLADFQTLPDEQLHPWTVAKKAENKPKNRFANVIAYDHSRVVLTPIGDDPHSDYINACFIDGLKEKDKYIASQGTNKASLNDIWRMVWQYNVDKIVMLTNPVENGKVKCLQYWPDSGAATYSDISVTIVNEEVFLDYSVRLFKVTQINSEEDCSRLVKQFHFTTWPDMKPPEYPGPLLNFMRVVNAHHNEGRTVIHCSAGVGRTGTYIALDSMLEQMNDEGQVDVLGFIHRMRQNRIKMVQTADQYKFIYDALLAAHLIGQTTYDVTHLRQQLASLQKMSKDSKETGMDKQFKTLNKIPGSYNRKTSNAGKLPENVDKNRYPDFIPTDRSRPFLMTQVHDADTDYINASFIPGYRSKNRYIGTQMPMPNTAADLWRLVYDQKSTCIVMLNTFDTNDETMARYWPEEEPIEFGPLVVEPIKTTKYKGVICRTLSLRNKLEESEATTASLFQYQDWPSDQDLPSSWQGMLTLMELTLKLHEEKSPIVVHCIDGLGRTVVYCTVMSLLEQFREEKVVDVFQAVLRLRTVNRNMMYSLDHYQMCYEVIQAYVEDSTIYENA